MSESRLRANLLLVLPAISLLACSAPASTTATGPPSLQVAPPSYYSRKPYYRRTVIPAQPAKGKRRATPETVIIEREVYVERGEPPQQREPHDRTSKIDEAQEQLRGVQEKVREQYRQMSPEVDHPPEYGR